MHARREYARLAHSRLREETFETSLGKKTQRAYARAEPAEEAGEWQADWQACRQELWSLALIPLVGNKSRFNVLFMTKTLIYRLQ